jgi:signal transduction histidine kinase
VGIWIFNDRARLLECEQRYVASTRTFSSGTTLAEKDYPLYFDALRRRRAVAADDALTDSATAELRESYLVPNGISSLLAAPLIRGGRLVGVVCHEHVGAPREWQRREIDFASTVADMVALVFEQCDRLTLEASLAAHAEQALENQKSEALRRLARAVGHDINNVLTSLSLSGGQLEQHNDPAVRELAGNVAQAVGLVHALAKQLLELGRASLASVRPSDVRAIIEAERMALTALLAGRATLSVEDHAKSACVGIVLREPTVEDGVTHDHLILEFSDDGVGMDEATRSRVFEPYFTTKDQGTGLGLALVHSAVVRAGGEVHVESSPGHGARFIVALPLAH